MVLRPKKGRPSKPRCTEIDIATLRCRSRGPLDPINQHQETIILTKAELQTLIDKDQDKKTMDQACQCMGVSKTVYAGIYSSAREKLTKALISGSILTIQCQD